MPLKLDGTYGVSGIVGTASSAAIYGADADSGIVFGTNETTITAGGVGVGTFSASGLVVSGITTVSAGSTAAPSISPSGDSNTGIFFPSPDTVAIGEGGVEALRVDSSGNIGVNTILTNPLGNGGTFKNFTVFTPGGYSAFGGISDLTASDSTIAVFNAGTLGASGAKNAASINVELDGTSTTNATGRIVFYTSASGSTTEKMRIDSSGRITASYNPCFLATRSSTQTYSTNNTIVFDTEVFDQNSNYNNSTGVFTAPVTGRYLLLTTVLVQGSTTGNEYDMQISTSNRNYYGAPGRIEYQLGTTWGDGYIAFGIHQIADMDVNDTAIVRFSTFGGGSIYGNGSGDWTRFSGYLLC